MSARSESSFRRVEAARAGLAVALGLTLLTLSWALLHVGFYERNQIVDTPVYQDYGDRTLAGEVPYRDFDVEYPPGALPVFILPSLAAADDYEGAFELVVWACAAGAIAFLALALVSVQAGTERLFAAVAFAGLAPLLLGSVVLTRYDFWPAALTLAALAALLAGRERLGFGALGLAVAAKIYPVALLPLVLVHVARRRSAREAGVGLALFAAVVAAAFAPFALLAPGGLAESVERQVSRPLQIESLGSAFLLAAHQVDDAYEPSVVSTHGSQNLAGALPDALAAAQTVLQALAVVGIWVLFAWARGGKESLLAASAAAVAGLVAFGKVLSPQFLVWLVPLVPLVAGRMGLVACAILGASLVTTQLWFPYRYWDVVALSRAGWLVLARDLLLIGLYALLAAATVSRARARLRRS